MDRMIRICHNNLFLKGLNLIFSKKILLCVLQLLFLNILSATDYKKSVLTVDEQKILKNMRITPAKFRLKANDFSGIKEDGVVVSLNDYRGSFILLNFWATWCYPCLKEMPDLEAAYRDLGAEKLVVLAVAMGEGIDKIRKFSKKNRFTFPLISDEDMEITKLYGVKNIPVTYLIDPHGIILGRALGIRNWSNPDLLNFMESRLK